MCGLDDFRASDVGGEYLPRATRDAFGLFFDIEDSGKVGIDRGSVNFSRYEAQFIPYFPPTTRIFSWGSGGKVR